MNKPNSFPIRNGVASYYLCAVNGSFCCAEMVQNIFDKRGIMVRAKKQPPFLPALLSTLNKSHHRAVEAYLRRKAGLERESKRSSFAFTGTPTNEPRSKIARFCAGISARRACRANDDGNNGVYSAHKLRGTVHAALRSASACAKRV